ncbi:MAG: hypothetical protein IPH93_13855 [Saprospiraceae bacterium]|nr:hypothetical protein [Saprospiraceae bacterium]MBK7810942.1 hypothetical protein [Saprospiraceae bacterium]MBK9630545.1 hypothetical protein [Saprospiraceae bacterium]
MTLQDFFNLITAHPFYSLAYCLVIPCIALVAGWTSEPNTHHSPWKYVFTFLIYAIAIPGIFAATLNLYFFFWERRSIMETNLVIQVLPFISMLATFWISARFISFDEIPGFGKLTALISIIAVMLTLMWILDRTRIFALTGLPFTFVIFLLLALVLTAVFSLRKMIR